MASYLGSLAQFNVNIDTWQIYQEQLDRFLEVNKIKNDFQKSALLSSIGQDAYKLLRDLCTPQLPKEKTFEELCSLMENHFTPKINIFRERNNFYAASQHDGESVADFTARLKNLSTKCSFGANLESILIDKFVFGLKSGKIKDRICEEKPTVETTFSQIVEVTLAKESYLSNEAGQVNWIKNKQGQQFRQKFHATGAEYKNSGSRHADCRDRVSKDTRDQGAQKQIHGQSKRSRINSKVESRRINSAPENNQCRVCGHLALMCNKSKSINFLNVAVDDVIHESLILNMETNELKPIILVVKVNGIMVKSQLDSGSGLTVISEKTFYELFNKNSILRKVFKSVNGYTGEKINVLGFFLVEMVFNANFLDDIIITGQDRVEHLNNLDKVFNILNEAGLKVKLSKCEFFKSEIEYLGHIISATPDCQIAFDKIKELVISDKVLVHFNPSFPIILTTDASNDGIAGCLSHKMPDGDERPISFISRTFMPAENNYSITDKEALAIFWSVRKLFQYLQNQVFTIRTDHKPLIGILGENKNIPTMASARFQRWAVFLAGFHYKLEYIKGNDNCTPDLLSRLPIEGDVVAVDSESQSTYMTFIESEYFPINRNTIKLQTNRDKIISKVYYYVTHGWPKSINDDLKPYKDRHTDLSVEQGCLMLGYRVVISSKSRKQILDELHSTHLGVVKMKAVARSYVWWPKIDAQIENLVESCDFCMQLRQNPRKSELIPWNRSSGVWQRVHIDFFGPFHNSYFLVVLDAFSKWLEVKEMRSITASNTIIELREIFSRWGLPLTLVSDNGAQLTSHEFTTFLKSNSIVHLRTAPGHLATNGAAENAVKATKRALSAALADKKNKNSLKKLRCRLDLLYKTDQEVVCEKQDRAIKNYNGSKEKVFNVGDEVIIKCYKPGSKESWIRATVNMVLGNKSYECESSEGITYIRHVDQMINVTLVNTESHFQESDNVGSARIDKDNGKEARTKKVPSKLKDFVLNVN
ncbi:Integrase, catalytic core,Aspartic peptidase domain,Ribonuclease H-like domain,Retrotransposon gag [Cinara cedri]|uniref:RNA-directed DNA polymerase n=1 Tax=Cinara cedri TaxID=506608 RepID=A0A5E4MYJ1_9HEMI|nr:Integrase, catalytic core,Aspartic peptidase domain,Ribonuclease H-like domain,Retrotransposon gag [Cinara cedri]